MNRRENYLRAVRFETPEHIPCGFAISDACYQHYPQDQLFDLMEAHPFLFPDFKRPQGPYVPVFAPAARRDEPYTDDFGCVWRTALDGIVGTVVDHPLADWSAFDSFTMPDPRVSDGMGPVDWAAVADNLVRARQEGRVTWGNLRHGHTFLRLCDLRGYQNVIFDMADEHPCLPRLLKLLEEFNLARVEQYVALGVDAMSYPEDLGMQNSPMLSPEHFRRYIRPSYRRIMAPAREKGILIRMHSDGFIRDFAEDIHQCGADIVNMQDLVNGIDWIAQQFAGRVCVELDIDRQRVTAMGTPRQIDELILEEVRKVGSRKGGLLLLYGLYPGVPLENVRAVMDAMQTYAFYYA